MCMPTLAPRDSSRSFADFVADLLVIPPRDFKVAPRLFDRLPCGCRATRAARKSGRRGLEVRTDGEVIHTRCGRVLARFDGTQFVLEAYLEPERPTVTISGPHTVAITAVPEGNPCCWPLPSAPPTEETRTTAG